MHCIVLLQFHLWWQKSFFSLFYSYSPMQRFIFDAIFVFWTSVDLPNALTFVRLLYPVLCCRPDLYRINVFLSPRTRNRFAILELVLIVCLYIRCSCCRTAFVVDDNKNEYRWNDNEDGMNPVHGAFFHHDNDDIDRHILFITFFGWTAALVGADRSNIDVDGNFFIELTPRSDDKIE